MTVRLAEGLVAALLLTGTGVAAAATSAAAPATATTGSATWSAVLVDANGADSTGKPLTFSWLLTLGESKYVSVRNNGTLPLSAQTYSLTKTTVLGGTVTATACVNGVWNTTSGGCSGSQVTLASTGSSVANSTVSLAVGATVPIKVVTTGALGMTANLSVSVTRAQARAAATTNS